MQQLADILEFLDVRQTVGRLDMLFQQIAFDSRKIQEGDLFVALRGTQVDGHHFIDKAIERGASVVVLEEMPAQLKDKITYVQVGNTQIALGQMAAIYYGHPSRQLAIGGRDGYQWQNDDRHLDVRSLYSARL